MRHRPRCPAALPHAVPMVHGDSHAHRIADSTCAPAANLRSPSCICRNSRVHPAGSMSSRSCHPRQIEDAARVRHAHQPVEQVINGTRNPRRSCSCANTASLGGAPFNDNPAGVSVRTIAPTPKPGQVQFGGIRAGASPNSPASPGYPLPRRRAQRVARRPHAAIRPTVDPTATARGRRVGRHSCKRSTRRCRQYHHEMPHDAQSTRAKRRRWHDEMAIGARLARVGPNAFRLRAPAELP